MIEVDHTFAEDLIAKLNCAKFFNMLVGSTV